MSLYSILFSPTGGTKKIVEQLLKTWSEDCVEIDLSDRTLDFSTYKFTSSDTCIISVPSFGGRVPEIAIKRISTLIGNDAKAVLVVSYGNRAFDDTLLELQEVVSGCGFHVLGAVAAVAEHSIMHQFGTGRPDMEDCTQLSNYARQLKDQVNSSNANETLCLPGNKPYRTYSGLPLKPKTSNQCTRCGICANKCPSGAISMDDPSKTNTDLCISCMRCVQICPVKARTNSKLLITVAGKKMEKSCKSRKSNELFINGHTS